MSLITLNNSLFSLKYSTLLSYQTFRKESVTVDFDDMVDRNGQFRVRRLCTPSTVTQSDPHAEHYTNWIWYWQDSHNTWNEYSEVSKVTFINTITVN